MITIRKLKFATAAVIVTVLVVLCIAAVVLVAMLTAAPRSVAENVVSTPASNNGPAARFAVFKSDLPASDRAELARLHASFARAPGSVADVNFDLARPAAMNGTPARAWLAPTPDKVCLFVPDPVDGYGATCASAEDIDAGKGIAILGGTPGSDTAVVAALVPNGDAPPSVVSDGVETPMDVSSNLAAAVVPVTARVKTAAGDIDLNFLRAASARACAVGADCSGK